MISVIGEAVVDLHDEGEAPIEDSGGQSRPFVGHPGGSPLNVAVGLARLERPAAFVGRLGRDAFGRMLRAHGAANRVDLTGVVDASEPSTAAIVSLDADRKAIYDFYVHGTADWGWTPAELDALPPGTRMVHAASIATWFPPGDAVIAARVGRARAEGLLTSYDPNVRPALMPADGVARVEQMVGQAHLVKASDDDVANLYPGVAIEEIAQRWRGLGAELVVVTRGAGGSDAWHAGGHVHADGLRVDVVDTVGAGDAFMSGLLGHLDRNGAGTPEGLAAFVRGDGAVEELLRFATVVAAITCSRAGANPPTLAEALAYSAR